MGVVHCVPPKLAAPDTDTLVSEPVYLNIYDLGTSGTGRLLNGMGLLPLPDTLDGLKVPVKEGEWRESGFLRPLGTGAFHCGVEVYGREWSYCEDGVFPCKPKACPGHTFHESVHMGTTPHARYVVSWIVERCRREWSQSGYHLLTHNCCHFCADLCRRLGAGTVPTWVLNLAHAGSLCESECCLQETFCCASPLPNDADKPYESSPEIIGVGMDERDEHGMPPVAKPKSGWRLRGNADVPHKRFDQGEAESPRMEDPSKEELQMRSVARQCSAMEGCHPPTLDIDDFDMFAPGCNPPKAGSCLLPPRCGPPNLKLKA